MKDCIVYLVWQLRQTGFDVRFTWPNILFISWKHHEGEYLSKQNPIVKAMAPSTFGKSQPLSSGPPPRQVGGSQKKKSAAADPIPPSRPTVAFNQEIDIITNTSSSAPFGAISRRAADYEPPASFIQTLDRPGPGRVPKEGAKGNVLADLWSI